MFPPLAFVAFATLAGAQSSAPGEYREAIVHGGVTRQYLLRIPPGYDRSHRFPLVVLLHGWTSSAAAIEATTGFGDKADRERFLLVVPEGLGKPQGWNAGFFDLTGAHHPDDVGFIDQLLDHVKSEVSVDPSRVFVAGHSNGGMMAHLLAARIGTRLAAIAVVEGTIGLSMRRIIADPVAPVSVLVIHGKRDGMVAYDSGSPALLKGISAPNSARWWAKKDGCQFPPRETVRNGGNVVIDTYTGGRQGVEVELMTIRNGMHDWPGGLTPTGFERATGVNAADLVWGFFRTHGRQTRGPG